MSTINQHILKPIRTIWMANSRNNKYLGIHIQYQCDTVQTDTETLLVKRRDMVCENDPRLRNSSLKSKY